MWTDVPTSESRGEHIQAVLKRGEYGSSDFCPISVVRSFLAHRGNDPFSAIQRRRTVRCLTRH
jgi:hypothetical protein